MYIVRKYIDYLYELYKQVEKWAFLACFTPTPTDLPAYNDEEV
jgi:hypothetical protein